jgi:hypothetical protein
MLALYQPPLLSGFGAELAKPYTRRHTKMRRKCSYFVCHYSHFVDLFKKVYTKWETFLIVFTECPVNLLTPLRLSPFLSSLIS